MYFAKNAPFMRYALAVLIGSLLVQLLVPVWWLFVPVTALAAFLLARSSAAGFAVGFLVNALIWLIWAGTIDHLNHSILSNRLAGVFGLPNGILLVVIGAVLAGLLGGLAGLGGAAIGAGRRAATV